MNALGLLLWLRLRGWGRRLGRGLKTVRGVLLAVIGGGMVLLWFTSLIIQQFVPWREQQPLRLDQVRLYAPLILLAYCVLAATTTAGERAVSFGPAEISFLFPGPFSRRQLLLYKIANTLFASLISTIIFTFVLRQYATSFSTAFFGLLLAMTFMQLFAMAVVIVGETIGSHANTRRRRLVIAAVLALIAGLLLWAGRQANFSDIGALLGAIAENASVQMVLTPLRWFADVFTAEQVWPDMIGAMVLSTLLNGALLAIVLGLDAHYLESAASASEKLYARIQRLRSGGAMAVWSGGAKPRFSLPDFPWLGGVGPIAWRQLVALSRGLKGFVFFLVIVCASLFMPVLFGARQEGDGLEYAHIFGATAFALTFLSLPMMLTFDFRGDVDRIDVLKTLPLAAWRLTVGQLLTPALVTTGLQVALVLVVQIVWGGILWAVLAALAFAFPVNFLLFSIENLLFLWFPTRHMAHTPGDFQMLGRHMLLYAAKFVIFGFTIGAASLVGTIGYFASGESFYAAGLACWPVVVAAAAALVPIVADAFKRFDVARDTPA